MDIVVTVLVAALVASAAAGLVVSVMGRRLRPARSSTAAPEAGPAQVGRTDAGRVAGAGASLGDTAPPRSASAGASAESNGGGMPFWGTLESSGRLWWLWTCLAGFGFGLVGFEYCRRRRKALRGR